MSYCSVKITIRREDVQTLREVLDHYGWNSFDLKDIFEIEEYDGLVDLYSDSQKYGMGRETKELSARKVPFIVERGVGDFENGYVEVCDGEIIDSISAVYDGSFVVPITPGSLRPTDQALRKARVFCTLYNRTTKILGLTTRRKGCSFNLEAV